MLTVGISMEKYIYPNEELSFLEQSKIPYAIYQFIDDSLHVLVLSKGFLDLFGYDENKRADIYTFHEEELFRNIHSDDIATIRKAFSLYQKSDEPLDVIYRVRIHEKYHIIHAYGTHIYKENHTPLSFVWYTEHGLYSQNENYKNDNLICLLKKELSERSHSVQANYDYLTGLSSMTYFLDLAENECKKIRNEKKTPAVVFFDFNGMKSYNQKYGMAAGDEFLKSFAATLSGYFQSNPISRFSSDHFCVLSDFDTAIHNSKQILGQNERSDRTLSLRIGIYPYEDTAISISEACDKAKIACDSKRNTYKSELCIFEKSLQKAIEKKQYVVENLDKAIQEGWISVYYQAIVRTVNGKVCSEEALTRWNDPEYGLMNPQDYIPILEETNCIYKLDLFVLDQVLRKMKIQAEHDLYVVPNTINLSKCDFYCCDIIEELLKRIDASTIPRDHLIIEMNENAIADDFDYMSEKISQLQKLGFPVWMDDFGSGFSSPALLQNIPFDLIKIDMSFVKQIEQNEKTKIIITEIVRLAMALGIDTLAEGVETKAQVEFLNDIGCTMLQGFYFTKPIPMKEILDRKQRNALIGFENPSETDYYVKLGKVNLYNLSSPHLEANQLKNYFDTWPMVMVECNTNSLSVVKCNETFKTFFDTHFSTPFTNVIKDVRSYKGKAGYYSLNEIMLCAKEGRKSIIDDRTSDGTSIQLLIWRVAQNPVNGVSAVMVVILSATESPSDKTALTYNYVARALAEDYVFLYFVNMDTGDFVEYSSDNANREVSIERHGHSFFEEVANIADTQIYKDDLDLFLNAFTKENIEKKLEENGTFSLIYRNMIHGKPVYVIMKIVKIRDGKNNIIIGVNNIDAQMKQKESLEIIKEERMIFSRIAALSGEVLAIYSVDPVTDAFFEFCSNELYDSIEIVVQGSNFYESTKKESTRVIYKEDMEYFEAHFKKEKILRDIQNNGMFMMNYRIVIQDHPVHVLLKATMIHENDENKLIVGVINVEREVRKNKEFEMTLSTIKMEAIRDDLTGVKRKNAYYSLEAQLNEQIKSNSDIHFAIVVCDINGLKFVNDTLGHQAGDQYIIDGCKMICSTFKRSPVFRLGGDEFAVVVQDEDYHYLDLHMAEMAEKNRRHLLSGEVVVATGMCKFTNEKTVAEVFKKADTLMYENKRILKHQVTTP
jgi:diguanylate cyclase (GGDEF)-like protein